jgi:hypothetical protein
LRSFIRIRVRKSLDEQNNLINEWRMKTGRQLLPDSLSLTALDAG